MIGCFSQMTAKEGKEVELHAALKTLQKLSREEPGCIAYEVLRERSNHRSWVVFEQFMSQEDFENHVTSTYVQSFLNSEYTSLVESHWDMDFDVL